METSDIKRTFILGDEWTFFKLYTGVRIADDILINQIQPLMNNWQEKGFIGKWFFIRYYDPEFHIRLRFQLTDTKYVGEVIKNFNSIFSILINQKLIWKIQSDMYVRELERYGVNRIDDAEKIFFHDSNMIVRVLQHIEDNENETNRWLVGLLIIDDVFNSFDLSLEEKKETTAIFIDFFKNEFVYDSVLKKQLSFKYRNNKKDIEEILSGDEKYSEIIDIIRYKNENIRTYIEKIKSNIETKEISFNLIFSFCHMSLNRLYRTNSRKNEFISYDLLFFYYKSMVARLKYNKKRL